MNFYTLTQGLRGNDEEEKGSREVICSFLNIPCPTPTTDLQWVLSFPPCCHTPFCFLTLGRRSPLVLHLQFSSAPRSVLELANTLSLSLSLCFAAVVHLSTPEYLPEVLFMFFVSRIILSDLHRLSLSAPCSVTGLGRTPNLAPSALNLVFPPLLFFIVVLKMYCCGFKKAVFLVRV